jgi:hypothetical protein
MPYVPPLTLAHRLIDLISRVSSVGGDGRCHVAALAAGEPDPLDSGVTEIGAEGQRSLDTRQ